MYKKNFISFIFILFLIIYSFGCVVIKSGTDFDENVVKTFEVGVTTKDEILTKLGDPYQKTINQTGQEIWMFMYIESKANVSPASLIVPFYTEVSTNTKSKILYLTFENDKLSNISWNNPYMP